MISRLVLPCLLFLMPLMAQNTLNLTSPTTIVRQGQSMDVTVVSNVPTASALQWNMSFPASTTVTAAPAQGILNTAVNKTLACGVSPYICLVYGFNTNLIPANTEVATYTIKFPSNAAVGQQSIALSSPLAGTANGAPISVTSGPSLSVLITKLQDMNNDGKVDAADAQVVLDQILGKTSCGTADFNGDGQCNLFDLQSLINAALVP